MESGPGADPELTTGLAIAGLTGGLLSAFLVFQRLLGDLAFEAFTGAWLGLTIALYLALARGHRSIAHGAALVALSAGAFFVATMAAEATQFVLMVMGAGRTHEPYVVSMFVGGSIGAWIVSSGTYGLYADSWSDVGRPSVECALAGGLLGVAGHALSGPLSADQAVAGHVAGPMFVLWQTGVALAMGLRWPETVEQDEFADAPVPRARVPIWVALLMLATAAPLIWSFTRQRAARLRAHDTQIAMAAYRATQPRMDNLQAVEAHPINYVTVARIGDYRLETMGPVVAPANSAHPQVVDYLACYSNVRGQTCAAIELRLTEYPTPEWAAYALRGLPATLWNGLAIGTEAVDTSFGQRILDRRVPSPGRELYWRSGTYVVHVRSKVDASPIIRAYLARYPSSL